MDAVESRSRHRPCGRLFSWLKLPYRGSFLACREITEAVGVSWVVLSGGAVHTVFVGHFEQALDGGASGCMARRSSWSNAVGMAGPLRLAWLEDEGWRRVEEVASRLDGVGRPWIEAREGI